MTLAKGLVGGVALSLLLSSCDFIAPRAAIPRLHPALTVQVVDARTGAPIGTGTRVIAQFGQRADTVLVSNLSAITSVDGFGPGNYTVTFSKDGYATATQSATVGTTGGRCAMNLTARLVASLQPGS